MVRSPQRSTCTDSVFPDPTLCRSPHRCCWLKAIVDWPLSRPDDRQRVKSPAFRAPSTHPPLHTSLCSPAFLVAVRQGRNTIHCSASRVPSCPRRSEEHTSELQSLMRLSYAVFCLTKKQKLSY